MVTYDYRIDWNQDGDFNDTGENVTSRVLRDSISIAYGRDQARAGSPIKPGEATFDLDNFTRDYSPENASSPLAAVLGPGKSVRIQATHLSTTYGLFRGYLDGFDVNPEARLVRFTCVDLLDKLRQTNVATTLYQGIRTGQAINLVLDAAGWPTADRDIDVGATTIRYWWAEGDAGEEIDKLILSEGPPALATIDADGKFVFRDRFHRRQRAASLTSQATFRAGTAADPRFSPPLRYDHGWRDVVNSVKFTVPVRQSDGEFTEIAGTSVIISVADGETREITVQASDPFIGAIPPVEFVDYFPQVGSATVTLTRTSGRSTMLRVKGVGGPAVIQDIKIRGYKIPVDYTVQIIVEDPTSIAKYGQRVWQAEAPWVNQHDALALAENIVARYAERLPIVTMRLVGYSDTNRTQLLTRDLSDRVTIVDSIIGLNEDFFVDRIEHAIRGAGSQVHETDFGCEKAPVPLGNFILNTSVLNTGTLGVSGFDNPTTMFVVGTSLLNTGILAH